ncbi:MAG: TIGR04255 family protein [Porticoccaceae bacterium]
MSAKMSNAPVYYALAQAQFNPVAAMAKYVDEVQDRLRREYPLYDTQQVTHLQFPVEPGHAPIEPQVAHTASWLITKGNRSSGFILSASSITLHTTHYDTSNEFIPELLRGLKAVHEVVGLDRVSRLGLRYLDAVLPQAGETVEQYLQDGLHGVRFSAKQKYALHESVFETESGPLAPTGTLVARVHRMTAPLGFPPDIALNGLVLMPKFDIKEPQAHAVIDTDHFVVGQMSMDFEKLSEQLLALHATIKLVFKATVTDHARVVWG